ncbi:GT-D fold domain-containing glycosyltransferase [Helicobacter sp. MIT 21-1697]|uniref:GT-D fold domain-containing glycosyltransferase n=1 Tax=Helicobacter sp. MIT 21-1697 TaxID=2993733 RepID=UPI00224A5171|nr:GT-D fold domain-containing glycosyltransferase [Helicobacter sp. MIT 21-1697]MCX2716494.1 GT-D fold domain-containing glycosyltransferase [Helicobacter sp. MIT 21-1697]
MKYSLRTFIRNLRYLWRYNLKEIDNKLHDLFKSAPTSDYFYNFAEMLRDEIKNDFDTITPPIVKDNFETLQILLDSQKSFIRFGDGEYILMEGGSIGFQKYDKNLAQTLQEIITSQDENLLIGLGYSLFHAPTENSRSPWFRYTWVAENYHIIKKYLVPHKVYGATDISQVYAGYKEYDFERHYALLKQLFIGKKILVICGDKVLANAQYSIFEECKDIAYLYGATKHAYEGIGTLRRQILNFSKDYVLLFALGPAGKALGYEMFKLGYRVLDIGHSIKDYDAYKRRMQMDKKGVAQFFAPDE